MKLERASLLLFLAAASLIPILRPEEIEDPRLVIVGGFAKRDIYRDVATTVLVEANRPLPLEWAGAPPLPLPLQGHAVIAARGWLHVFGGLTGFEGQTALYSREIFSSRVEKGRPTGWIKSAALPDALGYHAAAKAGNRILISGGFKSGAAASDSDEIWAFEIRENGTIGPASPAGRLMKPTRGHAAVVHKDRLFILGGHSDTGYYDDVYSAVIEVSGKLGPWAKTIPLPAPLVHFGAVVCGDFLYIFGGQDEKDALRDEIYAARISGKEISPWEKAGMLPAPSSRMTVNVRDKTIIMTGGGFGWDEPIFSGIYSAALGKDGKIGSWRKVGDLPRPLVFHGAVLWPEDLR